MNKNKEIKTALEKHMKKDFPRMYDNFDLLPELDLLAADIHGELESIVKRGKKTCEYLEQYKKDYKEIKKEAEEKKLKDVLEYLEIISRLISLCEYCKLESDKSCLPGEMNQRL